MRTTFWLELRRDRSLTLGLTVVSVAYAGTMALFWPIMRDNSALIEQYLAILPQEMLAAFGMEGSLADPGVFYTTYVSSWLWPILAILAGVIMASRPVAVDLERGFLELPLGTALSRVRYLGATIAAQALALAVLATVTVFGFWVAATVAGAPYDLGRMAVVALLSWTFAAAIAAVTSALAVLTLSRAVSAGIVIASMLTMYVLNAVSMMKPEFDVVGTVSVLRYFRVTALLDKGQLPLAELALFGAIAAIGWTGALWRFRTRDLAA